MTCMAVSLPHHRSFFLTPLLLSFSLSTFAAEPVPSFPGAEGFGAKASGGRGGDVVFVTNLEDSGEGSLRAAVAASGPRTVVFRVGGTIRLTGPLAIANDDITIAGQTAPDGGITLRGGPLLIKAQNVIVRHIRSRLGDETYGEDDAIWIMGGARDVILDHVSASWSLDESLSPSGNIKNVTLQWCMIAESLNNSHHKKGAHGYGSLLRATGGVTLHHNLYAHHRGRNPRFGDNYGGLFAESPTFDFRNNVIYDWGDYASGLVDGKIMVNYVGNYLRPGPSTKIVQPISLTKDADEKTRFFIADNFIEGRDDLIPGKPGFMELEGGKPGARYTLVPGAFTAPAVTTQSAQAAYLAVLANAGATAPMRDAVDQRIVTQVTNRTGKLLDSQNEVGGWPALPAGQAPMDSDGDGIPDDWELAHGLNPKNPKDAQSLRPDGYTQLEAWLNELAERQPATPVRATP